MRKSGSIAAVAIALTLGAATTALTAEEGFLGILLDDETAATLGASVEDVAPGSPAEKAGIKRGDFVTAWNGEKVAHSHALIAKLLTARPGDEAVLTVTRGEWEKDMKVVLARHPGEGAPATPARNDAATVAALRAFFEAKDKAERSRTIAALASFVVPKDPVVRAKLLREALARPAQAASTRFTEQRGEPPHPSIIATPTLYDSSKTYPAVVGLSAYCHSARSSMRVFSLPDEEWKELQGEDPDLKKDGQKKPTPLIPWSEGIVLAPEIPMTGSNAESFVDSRTRILEIIARANRSFGVDPDRVTVAGMSMGGEIAYDVVARHPDRFAGLACVSGGMTQQPTPLPNLKTTKVFIMHGTEDKDVDVSAAYENSSKLDELKVEHVLTILQGHGHHWPKDKEDGERIAKWLREQKRDAWPRELDLIFAAYPDSKDPKRRIYWIEVPDQNRNRRVTASVADNVITLGELLGFEKCVLHLGEPLVDLDREVVVKLKDRELFRGKLERSWRALVKDLESDGWDTTRAAPVRLELDLVPPKK